MADEEEVTCPVCGKPVGLDVLECPYCGAEFEEEEEEEPTPAPAAKPKGKPAAAPAKPPSKPAAKPPPAEEDEEVSCPVCGKVVGLEVTSCPNCGAEFEEEEVEEVIEVEERQVAKPVKVIEEEVEEIEEAEEEEEEEEEEEAEVKEALPLAPPPNISDLRVIGYAFVLLGIVGTQIALMIDWYWSWVPPIEDNLPMFVMIPVIVLVVALLMFMLVKRMSEAKKKPAPKVVPGISLTLFLFGILGLVVMLLWDPINSALQDSQAAVGGAFALVLIVGILLVFMGMRSAEKAACD